MNNKSDFFHDVWQVVLLIPHGRVTTYGAIARYLGSPAASRTVGYAMNASHHSTVQIPAHRVVNRQGLLTGKNWFGGPEVMQNLLESEGVEVRDDKIIHFEKHFWDPNRELM